MRTSRIRISAALLIACLSFVGAPSAVSCRPAGTGVKNVILLIPDGMSLSDLVLTRWYQNGRPLAMDAFVEGLVRTYCADALITDSAAAASAYATGRKIESEIGFHRARRRQHARRLRGPARRGPQATAHDPGSRPTQGAGDGPRLHERPRRRDTGGVREPCPEQVYRSGRHHGADGPCRDRCALGGRGRFPRPRPRQVQPQGWRGLDADALGAWDIPWSRTGTAWPGQPAARESGAFSRP